MSVIQTQSGEDMVFVADRREYAAGAPTEALRINGNTGEVTLPSTKFAAQWNKDAADGAAGTATAEHAFFRAPTTLTLKSVVYVPDAALTADDANNATITVRRRNSDGTSSTSVAVFTTSTTGTGNWAQWVAETATLLVSSMTVGQILTVQITKAGTGVAVPAGQLVVDYVVG